MTINASDVQIMRAERATDEVDGGGQMTGFPIVDGDINNLWDDIPRTVMAFGGVSLRKLFCAIRAINTDKFLGAHAMISQDSAAENVSTLLFNTDDFYDERSGARDKIESFVVVSTRSALRPVGTQRKGQSSLIMYTGKGEPGPEMGDVIVLVAGAVQQYVKINDIKKRDAVYLYQQNEALKEYAAVEYTLGLTQALLYDFAGTDPAPLAQHATVVYRTQPSTSSRYYGMASLAQPAVAGDRSLVVDDIFAHLVPSATTESALLDQRPGALTRAVVPAALATMTIDCGSQSGSVTLTLPTAAVPGSVKLTVAGSVYQDKAGGFALLSGAVRLSSGTLAYADGVLTLTLTTSGSVVVEYLPGAAVELLPFTDAVEITAANRQLTYSASLQPAPLPGTFRVDYLYMGAWYVLQDDGTGGVTGDGGASGVVNYSTGSVSFSLPAEPDAGSSLIYTWAQSPLRAEQADIPVDAWVQVPLAHDAVPGSVTLAWSRGGTAYNATEGAAGALSGGAAGLVEHAGRFIRFKPAVLPDSAVTVSYQRRSGDASSATRAVPQTDSGSVALSLGEAVEVPSVRFDLQVYMPYVVSIDGVDNVMRVARTLAVYGRTDGSLYTMINGAMVVVGSVVAATGAITINVAALKVRVSRTVRTAKIFGTVTKIVHEDTVATVMAQQLVIAYSTVVSAAPVSEVNQVADMPVKVSAAASMLVPGSLVFKLGSDLFVDREGVIYKGWDAATAAGTSAGAVVYAAGDVSLDLARVSSLSAQRLACCSGFGAGVAVNSVVFRTNAAPLRPSGLQFLARRASDYALLVASSDADGVVSGSVFTDNVVETIQQTTSGLKYSVPVVSSPPLGSAGPVASGAVDYQRGTVTLNFAWPVVLSELTYNAVAYSSVPLDADIIGLDPVKLPSDGRVPKFQAGYLVVVHHTDAVAVATPLAGQVIDCGRVDLAQVKIVGANGLVLDPAQYTVNRTTGKVTLADPFTAQDVNAVPLTLPLSVQHRVEDMAGVGSVAVGGQMKLITPLTRDYPAGVAKVSAAVQFGTLQARVHHFFCQKVDVQGVYADALSGDASVASYDDLNYPVLIDNQSAVAEKWKIKFTTSSSFECIGQHLGVVGTGSVGADFSPVNPMTGRPYFTLRAAGWGSGWVSSNLVRFNTDSCAAPLWAVRTVLPSNARLAKDNVVIEFRGDAD